VPNPDAPELANEIVVYNGVKLVKWMCRQCRFDFNEDKTTFLAALFKIMFPDKYALFVGALNVHQVQQSTRGRDMTFASPGSEVVVDSLYDEPMVDDSVLAAF
jgi:transposase-like protein